jgi:hypothetical protein
MFFNPEETKPFEATLIVCLGNRGIRRPTVTPSVSESLKSEACLCICNLVQVLVSFWANEERPYCVVGSLMSKRSTNFKPART